MTSDRLSGFALLFVAIFVAPTCGADAPVTAPAPAFSKPRPISMAELSAMKTNGVSVTEVSDYAFPGYTGDYTSPPHGDINARKAFIIQWEGRPYRFVFSHDASYCPFFQFPSGAGTSFQWWEGNDGWAEPLCDFGRMERYSFVDIVENSPKRVWVRWNYISPNPQSGEGAYRAAEDFWAYPNGLIQRRQTYESLRPKDHHGYSREPLELIGIAPPGKMWPDVLRKMPNSEERHSLAALDVFSDQRYDDYWTPKSGGAIWDSSRRREGCDWKAIDDAKGIVLSIPLIEGSPFCIFGDASGFRSDYTRVSENSFPEQRGLNWGSSSWDHWPVGWINSRGHEVDAASVKLYPNHFSPACMDFFALPNEVSAQLVCYTLIGVGGEDLKPVKAIARRWLDQGPDLVARPESGASLPALLK